MKPKCISDYVFLEENADPSCRNLKSSLFLHLATEILLLIFKHVSGSPQYPTTFPKLYVYVLLHYIQHSSWFALGKVTHAAVCQPEEIRSISQEISSSGQEEFEYFSLPTLTI